MEQAREVLNRYFGYPDFRPPQRPAIEAVLSRRDAVIVLPTGGGKSICFQVPALLFPRLTVVVSPLISLMADQVQALDRRGISATFLNSTLSPEESGNRVERIRRGETRLLYLAPERLAVGQTVRLLKEVGVDLLVVDEAHCVSEWGQDFRPSYLRLSALREEIGAPQTVALTATATPRVRRDIARLLGLRGPVEVVGGFDRPNLSFRVQRIKDATARNLAMVSRLAGARDPAVVYAATRRQVELVVRILAGGRVRAVGYHAGLAPERRGKAQDAFMSGAVPVIVATNAFGMGIDKPDVRLVLHYIHSGSLEDYYQEAGRAGRDGARSNCLLLFNRADRGVHDRMRDAGRPPLDLVRQAWLALSHESRGQRPVTLDPHRLASRLGKGTKPESVRRAIELLAERGILPPTVPTDTVRLRVLATDLRLEGERPHLSLASAALLHCASHASRVEGEWAVVTRSSTGLTDWQIESAVGELESRQLVFADRPPRLAILGDSLRDRARLERCLSQLRTRLRVERSKLDAMVAYTTTPKCRRAFILRYFGEVSAPDICGYCDVCERQPAPRPG